MTTPKETTVPTTPDAVTSPNTCCGEGGAWAPPAGKPVVNGCMLCPRSPTYWRTNRADGKPYQPARAAGEPTT